MEILGVKENLYREAPQISVQKQADKPEPPKEPEKPAPPPEVPKVNPAPSEETIKALTENLNSFMRSMSYSLQFVLDKENGQVVIKVLDGEGKVIRRIPPEAMTSLSSSMGSSVGMVVNETLE